jgi:hypothetical protein
MHLALETRRIYEQMARRRAFGGRRGDMVIHENGKRFGKRSGPSAPAGCLAVDRRINENVSRIA